MQKSGFQLTINDLELLRDDEFLPAKRRLIDKLSGLLHDLGLELEKDPVLLAWYQRLGASKSFKITRGENYKDLPYVVLDLPKINPSLSLNIMRIMIWWGRYASINLFLSQEEWTRIKKRVLEQHELQIIICRENLWENEMSPEFYDKINQHSIDRTGENGVRIGTMVSLDELESLLPVSLKLIELLGD